MYYHLNSYYIYVFFKFLELYIISINNNLHLNIYILNYYLTDFYSKNYNYIISY